MARTEVCCCNVRQETISETAAIIVRKYAGVDQADGKQGRLGEEVSNSQNTQGRYEQASYEFPCDRGKRIPL